MPVHNMTADEVVEQLPEELRITLALLGAVDDDVIELTLASLPFGSRLTLVTYGVIDPMSPHDRPTDIPVEVKLTDFGGDVIDAAHMMGLPESVRMKLRRLEDARQQRRFEEEDDPVLRVVQARKRSSRLSWPKWLARIFSLSAVALGLFGALLILLRKEL
jgi:hypothetical protein